jgi:hypothetical protein
MTIGIGVPSVSAGKEGERNGTRYGWRNGAGKDASKII